VLSTGGPATIPFAHPVAGQPHVDIPIALSAAAGALVVLAVALVVTGRRPRAVTADAPATSWEGRLSSPQVVTRVLAVVVLLTTIAAGRLGADDELENLAPALIIGVAPVALVVLALLTGPVWRWVDPWDAVARVLSTSGRAHEGGTPRSVWPAAAIAVPLMWYVSVYLDALSPRAVGTVLALYTVVTVGGCVAFGRGRWLASAEPIGITLTWIGLLPRRRLADWTPPRGAEALLGVLAGGFLFGLVRPTEAWTELTTGMSLTRFTVYASVGLVVTCLLFAGFLMLMGVAADLVGSREGVARAAVLAVAAIVVVVSLARDRLFTAAQLLPGLLGDPFGLGWDLFGPALDGLNPAPLSAGALLGLQLGILALVMLVAAVVAVRRVEDRVRRLPVGIALMYLTAASVVAVTLH